MNTQYTKILIWVCVHYLKYVYSIYRFYTYCFWKCWGPVNVFRAGSSTKRMPLFNPKTGLGFRYMFYLSRFGFNWLMFLFKRVETTLVSESQNVLAMLVMISPKMLEILLSSSEFRTGEKCWINGSAVSCKNDTGRPTIARGVDTQDILWNSRECWKASLVFFKSWKGWTYVHVIHVLYIYVYTCPPNTIDVLSNLRDFNDFSPSYENVWI